jgi:hypothetical protein
MKKTNLFLRYVSVYMFDHTGRISIQYRMFRPFAD